MNNIPQNSKPSLYYKLFLIVLVFTAGVIVAGIKSNVSMGDEPYHLSFAKNIYETQSRLLYETEYSVSPISKRIFVVPPFWHSTLALIWTVLGGVNVYAAQIYQGLFYALYIIASFLLCKEIYGEKNAIWAALFSAVTPFAIAYSIMLYLDVALSAMAVMMVYLYVKRQLWWAGVVLGMTLSIKQNGYFFIPPLVLLMLINQKGFKEKAVDMFKVFIPALIIIAPDIYYRIAYINPISLSIFFSQTRELYPLFYPQVAISFVHPSDIFRNPLIAIGEIGLHTIIGIALFFVLRCWEKKDMGLAIIIGVYLILFLYFFRHAPGARYLAPILPFINILAPKAVDKLLTSGNDAGERIKKTIAIMLIAGCFIQYAVGVYFIYNKRTISEGLKEAYEFVKKNTKPDATLLSIERAVSIYSGRRVTYSSEASLYESEASLNEIGYLYFDADEEEIADILKRHNISHIFVKKERIYQNTPHNRSVLGFPKSFIDRLSTYTAYFKKTFENDEAVIWEFILQTNTGVR